MISFFNSDLKFNFSSPNYTIHHYYNSNAGTFSQA